MKRISKAKRYRYEKLFWLVMIAPTVLWLRNSVLWVALLSIYALVISSASAEEAALAADKAEEAQEAKNED